MYCFNAVADLFNKAVLQVERGFGKASFELFGFNTVYLLSLHYSFCVSR